MADKCELDLEQVQELEEIEQVLVSAGPMFSGDPGDVRIVAREWLDEDFTPSGVSEWIEAGFWMPSVASRLYDAGWSTSECVRRAAELRREGICEDAIYAMCNGDFPVARFTEEGE